MRIPREMRRQISYGVIILGQLLALVFVSNEGRMGCLLSPFFSSLFDGAFPIKCFARPVGR